jgi:exodeoxyribonuclease VII large subunit
MSFAAGAETIVDFSRDIWSVSRLNAEVRAVLDGSFPLLWIQGEVSNLSRPASGHIYFTLKDEAAQVRCAMFRPKRLLLSFSPANGQQVLLRARVGLYEGRGDYQLLVEHMEPAGEGALRIELDRRKRRLAAEGLFDEARKRRLPSFPRRIGLITSPSGAALHDLLTVLRRRLPLLPVLIYPAQVQGDGAAATLIDALELANRRGDCDVLILARGGGSLEDLMPFNDEGLARAIRASRIPVVTGVGHEVDVSIADLAADRRGATPSAAAELCTPSVEHLGSRIGALHGRLMAAHRQALMAAAARVERALRHLRLLHPISRLHQLAQGLDHTERRLDMALHRRLQVCERRLRPLASRLDLASPARRIQADARALSSLQQRLMAASGRLLSHPGERLSTLAQRLQALSPLATLARGYAIVTLAPAGQVVTDARQVPGGSRLDIRLARGMITAVVEPAGK